MDQKIKAKWVAALRSGKYKQGQNMLHDPSTDGYCCLGVLVDIQGGPCDSRAMPRAEYCAGLSYLQLQVLAAANDGTEFEIVHGTDTEGRPMNEHSFAQIADYIEAKL